MDISKKKVFKHILRNPFSTAWPTLSEEQSLGLVNVLAREIEAQTAPGQLLPQEEDHGDTPVKRRKTNETNVTRCAKRMIMLGIRNILETQIDLAVIVVLRSVENQVLVEPLLHFSRLKQIKIVAISQDIALNRLNQVTGVRRLAAFAIPKGPDLPVTLAYLSHHAVLLPPIHFLPVVLQKIETTPKTDKLHE